MWRRLLPAVALAVVSAALTTSHTTLWSLSRQRNGLGPSLGMWPEQLDPRISSGDDHSSSSKHLVCTPHRST